MRRDTALLRPAQAFRNCCGSAAELREGASGAPRQACWSLLGLDCGAAVCAPARRRAEGASLPLCSAVPLVALSPAVCMGSWSPMNLWNHLLRSHLSSELRGAIQRRLCCGSAPGSVSFPRGSWAPGLRARRGSAALAPGPVSGPGSARPEAPRGPCWAARRVRCSSRRLPAMRYAAVRKKSRNWVRRRNFCSLKNALAMPPLEWAFTPPSGLLGARLNRCCFLPWVQPITPALLLHTWLSGPQAATKPGPVLRGAMAKLLAAPAVPRGERQRNRAGPWGTFPAPSLQPSTPPSTTHNYVL